MRDTTFTLEPAAAVATPPFRYGYIASRHTAFWRIREGNGRAIGRARTRAGARAGVRALYEARDAARVAIMAAFALSGCAENYYACRQHAAAGPYGCGHWMPEARR